jgi:hypothetical protein
MWNGRPLNDPTGQILSTWIAKEELRRLLGAAARGGHRHEINARLYGFYTWCADAEIPELTNLAETIETWRSAVACLPQDPDHQRPHRASTAGSNTSSAPATVAAYACIAHDQPHRERRESPASPSTLKSRLSQSQALRAICPTSALGCSRAP